MKKIIGLTLSSVLVLSLFSSLAFAQSFAVDLGFEQIYEIGTRLLSDIEHEKAMYGLGDVDFSNLYIGEHIPAYITEKTHLTPSAIRYYPILENGQWVITLAAAKTNGVWNGQISNSFVNELPLLTSNDSLALVFDNDTAYLSKNSALNEISSFNEVIGRADISLVPMTINVTLPFEQLSIHISDNRLIFAANTSGIL